MHLIFQQASRCPWICIFRSFISHLDFCSFSGTINTFPATEPCKKHLNLAKGPGVRTLFRVDVSFGFRVIFCAPAKTNKSAITE